MCKNYRDFEIFIVIAMNEFFVQFGLQIVEKKLGDKGDWALYTRFFTTMYLENQV